MLAAFFGHQEKRMKNETIVQSAPLHIGDLTQEELKGLTDLRQQSEQTIYQLGLNRLAEQRLLMQLRQVEQANQMALNQIGNRLGIPDGTAWQVTQEGQALLVTPPPTSPKD